MQQNVNVIAHQAYDTEEKEIKMARYYKLKKKQYITRTRTNGWQDTPLIYTRDIQYG